jgi:hypothetical protein
MTARAAPALFIAALACADAAAEPITAADRACYGAGWIAAEGQDCNLLCGGIGMAAEGMKIAAGDQEVFLCRHRGAESQGFGEQTAGVCRIGLAEGFLAEHTSYECLCVTTDCPAGPPDPGPPGFTEDCLPFNTAGLSVESIGGRWKIVEGSHWLFDFADNEAEAREAFKAIHFQGFNQVCYVGRPGPSMTYLKTGARVPAGDAFGFDCIPFDPGSAAVSQEGSQWLLTASGSRMLVFPSEQEARTGLDVIASYGLNRQCFVGRPDPSFEFWLAR